MHQHLRPIPKRVPSTGSPQINPTQPSRAKKDEEIITRRNEDAGPEMERRGSATGSIRSEEVAGGSTKSEAEKINLIVQVRILTQDTFIKAKH